LASEERKKTCVLATPEERLQQAVTALRSGRPDAAAEICRSLLRARPKEARALNILAAIAHRAGRLGEAERLWRRALAAKPGDPQIMNNLASLLDAKGEAAAALALFERCLALAPDYAGAHANLGIALERQGRAEAAVTSHRTALRLAPASVPYRCNLGNALRAAGRLSEAEAAYRDALGQQPDYPPALANLAGSLRESGRLQEALALYREALARQPGQVPLLEGLGSLQLALGELAAAEEALRRAIALAPDRAALWRDLGLVLFQAERLGEASDCLDRALARDPKDLGALLTKGQIVSNSEDLQSAVALLERARAVAPDNMKVLVTLMRLYQRLCRWADYAALLPRLDALEAAYQDAQPAGVEPVDVEPPLFHITRCDVPARNLLNARRASAVIERRAGAALEPPAKERRQRSGPLRVGYLSRDFRDHPVGHLVRGLFAAHDRARCRVTAYSYGPDDGSLYRRAAEEDSDRFRDIAGLSHHAAAACIRDDGIDILVDLAGHTNLSRLEICALKPAPLQATYLGFPGGSGAGFFDYLIGDRVVTPPAAATDFQEALAILPHAYQVNDRDQVVAESPADRAAAGLPDSGFVFACFNQPFKFDAEVFDTWMRLLRDLPESLLWLFDETGGLLARRLRAAAEAAGVAGARLVFAPRVPKAQHLARLTLADLMLDTRLYNGHTTTSDALFAGLPVVTLRGRHFASRVSASLLEAVGLGELVTDSLPAYEALARRLAEDPAALAALRARLAANRLSAPLFDTALTARHLEVAYAEMWAIHAAGEAPRQILVQAEAAP